ncbi:DUF2852 domain-containing protein [Neorhizobium sp. NPDC001467]|uniref:DUF2852 domain-containing protein n=1 Tax=Neorhizobium sp. NPDC001467 TaxID=3390595 RepID=UPI003D08CB2F
MTQSALIRPDWTPATVALMVVGFFVFWPLGLAVLAYILFGEKFGYFKRSADEKAEAVRAGFRRARGCYDQHFATGNVAFDEWRREELDRIEEQRRKLDEMRSEFDEYMRELRCARDREEFERFMRERGAGTGGRASTTD